MTDTRKKIVILGSTGSIGTQALEVIADNPERFEVIGLAAGGSQPDLLVRQARQWHLPAERIAVADPAAAPVPGVITGPQAARDLVVATAGDADVVLNALVGSQGLAATLAIIDSGATLALANKESLVAGGDLTMARLAPGQLVPVDSEHSAMAQCLRSGRGEEVAKLVLTASGGPFRGRTREEMLKVTPAQAAAHPTWSMGQMNTLNSATLVNKGLELIEASLIFGVDPACIEVSVHPQSIVHSAVTFVDGATIAQASYPSMKLPIALALNWPHRVPGAEPAMDFTQAATWEFEPVDNVAFPAVELAREVATKRGTYPAVYNAANEQAAAAFLAGQIRFPEIVDIVAEVVSDAFQFAGVPSTVSDILAAEDEARRRADVLIARLAR